MPVATRTDSFVAATITQQNLYDGIKQAFVNAGYSAPFDEFTSGTDKIAIYKVDVDTSKTYGSAYLRIRVNTSLGIGSQIFSNWTVSTHAGLNGSSEIGFNNLPINIQVNFVSLNANPEYKMVLLYQAGNYYPLGYISPINRPLWWDLNNYPYVFIPHNTNFGNWRMCNLHPYFISGTNYQDCDTTLNNGRMGNANSITNRRDVLSSVIIYTQGNQGIAGKTSDDMVMVAANGATRFDTIQIPGDTKEYLLINPASGGLAVRVA